MESQERSEQACPVCGKHTLALDEPPRIDIMGIQPYSDMLGMGDLQPVPMGIICLSCGTHWRSREAFDRGEAEPEEGSEPGEGIGLDEDAWPDETIPGDAGPTRA
jgi:hypothetical protein